MALRTDSFDLAALRLAPGEGRRLELNVMIDPFVLGGEHYPVQPRLVATRLDISRTVGSGYALRMRFRAALDGPCMRCLERASPVFEVDAREVSQPERRLSADPAQRGGQSGAQVEALRSPYVEGDVLDLAGWARDALALALPATLVCEPDCAGLCAVCGMNLNEAGDDHRHERGPDPRWAKLSEVRFE